MIQIEFHGDVIDDIASVDPVNYESFRYIVFNKHINFSLHITLQHVDIIKSKMHLEWTKSESKSQLRCFNSLHKEQSTYITA